ncbi:hypothetical protein F2Q70_00043114 [Brassica cretica]|uniref:Uncharacterized protein n=1 Tax=Brassica cretica TaxID=69181 RepID=A0A8S9KN68_BRACR|nr:hypothetical protein F2Q70_00043114 [Brassica cretica]
MVSPLPPIGLQTKLKCAPTSGGASECVPEAVYLRLRLPLLISRCFVVSSSSCCESSGGVSALLPSFRRCSPLLYSGVEILDSAPVLVREVSFSDMDRIWFFDGGSWCLLTSNHPTRLSISLSPCEGGIFLFGVLGLSFSLIRSVYVPEIVLTSHTLVLRFSKLCCIWFLLTSQHHTGSLDLVRWRSWTGLCRFKVSSGFRSVSDSNSFLAYQAAVAVTHVVQLSFLLLWRRHGEDPDIRINEVNLPFMWFSLMVENGF